MAERNRFSLITIPAILYGGVLSVATDGALLLFYDTSIQTIHTGIYFWGQSFCMFLWCLIMYPKFLWAWTCGTFAYPHSNWKLPYTMAFLVSFIIHELNAICIGLLVQKFLPDPFFSTRILYIPTSTLTALYIFEFTGLNELIRRILLHDL